MAPGASRLGWAIAPGFLDGLDRYVRIEERNEKGVYMAENQGCCGGGCGCGGGAGNSENVISIEEVVGTSGVAAQAMRDAQCVIVTVPVTEDESIERRFGKAPRMAVAKVCGDGLLDWQVYDVNWDVLHDQSQHGEHHARIVKFMRENQVERVLFEHMGPPMMNTLNKMGLTLIQVDDPDSFENAKEAAVAAGQLEV